MDFTSSSHRFRSDVSHLYRAKPSDLLAHRCRKDFTTISSHHYRANRGEPSTQNLPVPSTRHPGTRHLPAPGHPASCGTITDPSPAAPRDGTTPQIAVWAPSYTKNRRTLAPAQLRLARPRHARHEPNPKSISLLVSPPTSNI